MASPYDPYVPIEPDLGLLRQDTVRRAHGAIQVDGGDSLYRVVDTGPSTVVVEGSRDACLDRVIDTWWDTPLVAGPRARARAEAAALRLRFERWDPARDAWIADLPTTNAMVEMHRTI